MGLKNSGAGRTLPYMLQIRIKSLSPQMIPWANHEWFLDTESRLSPRNHNVCPHFPPNWLTLNVANIYQRSRCYLNRKKHLLFLVKHASGQLTDICMIETSNLDICRYMQLWVVPPHLIIYYIIIVRYCRVR